ncbi:hypothetical protein AN958_05751 [Leucoagaricus sp. SymC.cos]|nr:hypothetical protein AN958_05751 [Leucoagaricus sp. SymC.cos]
MDRFDQSMKVMDESGVWLHSRVRSAAAAAPTRSSSKKKHEGASSIYSSPRIERVTPYPLKNVTEVGFFRLLLVCAWRVVKLARRMMCRPSEIIRDGQDYLPKTICAAMSVNGWLRSRTPSLSCCRVPREEQRRRKGG